MHYNLSDDKIFDIKKITKSMLIDQVINWKKLFSTESAVTHVIYITLYYI